MKKIVLLLTIFVLISCKPQVKETNPAPAEEFIIKKIETLETQNFAYKNSNELLKAENKDLKQRLDACEGYLDVLEETKSAP